MKKARRSKVKEKGVFGVGTNDADYAILLYGENGEIIFSCPFYTRWKHMLYRCYDPKYQFNKPTYIGCKVCDEWLYFSNFKRWMQTQDWEGKQLDKDLMNPKGDLYSPETCLFLPEEINNALHKLRIKDNGLPIGVCYQRHKTTIGYYERYVVTYYDNGRDNLKTSKSFSDGLSAFRFFKEVRISQLEPVFAKHEMSRFLPELENRFDHLISEMEDGIFYLGTFIKQTNLDTLQELGITYDKELQAFTGIIYLDKHLKRADEVFYNLGITYTTTGDYSSGVYVESTGKV